MAKRGRPKAKIQLHVGEDPSLWRFADMQSALQANTSTLSRLIVAGEAQRNGQGKVDDPSS